MSKLPPKKSMDVDIIKSTRLKGLSIAVVMQRGDSLKVYEVSGDMSQGYLQNFVDVKGMPSMEAMENEACRIGKVLDNHVFQNEIPALMVRSGLGTEGEYAIYNIHKKES